MPSFPVGGREERLGLSHSECCWSYISHHSEFRLKVVFTAVGHGGGGGTEICWFYMESYHEKFSTDVSTALALVHFALFSSRHQRGCVHATAST